MKQLLAMLVSLVISASALAEVPTTLTSELNGRSITYTYSGGRSYQVKFETEGVRYRYLSGKKPEKWWGPFPYQALVTDQGEYLASWFEKGYADYVTLLINLNTRTLYGSAILGGKNVHFQRGQISNVASAG